MATYTYADCLANSYKINWRIDDVIGGQEFDLSKRWLPPELSGADQIACLNDEEKIKLTQVEMGSYSHLFGFVEEFIAPTILGLAQDFQVDQRDGFNALTNFAAEEVKHMNLFRQVRQLVDDALGLPLDLLPGQDDVAKFVMSKNLGGVLLLTEVIEWFTQLHYVSAMKDHDSLDPFTKRIFRAHWQEESQHALMDHLEVLRAFGSMNDAEKDEAIADLIELVGAVDGLLQVQSGLDVDNLEKCLGRTFSEADRAEITDKVLAAKRYMFIESGATHPKFQETFTQVTTPEQQETVGAALAPLLAG